jgi:predicted lipoprotein with Yx(FWY)xxD motif
MARSRTLLLIGVIAVTAAACGGNAADTTTTGAPATTVTTAADPTTTVAAPTTTDAPATTAALEPPYLTMGETDLGAVLTDDTGRTLYLFTPDNQGDSTCTGGCATTWPPFTGDVSAGPGVDASLLGSITRGDGTTQATYNGWPLYRYAPDTEPGQTGGHGVGGVWFAVDVDGEPVE